MRRVEVCPEPLVIRIGSRILDRVPSPRSRRRHAAPSSRLGNVGAARVFVRIGTTWSEEATLSAADGAANDDFGYAAA